MSTFTIISNNNNAPTSSIVWSDTQTTENRVGVFSSVSIGANSIIDIEGSTIYSLWQINLGSGFVDNIFLLANPETFNITTGVTQFRLKNTDAFGMIGYSNILQYSYNPPTYENYLNSQVKNDSISCGTIGHNTKIGFNTLASKISNRLGVDYVGSQPSILRILSYTNTVTEERVLQQDEVAIPHTPNVIKVTATNVAITFPYNIPLNTFTVNTLPISLQITDNTFVCPIHDPSNIVTYVSIIEYEVFDNNGISGGIKSSTIINKYNFIPATTDPPGDGGEGPLPGTTPLSGYTICLGINICDPLYPSPVINYIDIYGQYQSVTITPYCDASNIPINVPTFFVHQFLGPYKFLGTC